MPCTRRRRGLDPWLPHGRNLLRGLRALGVALAGSVLMAVHGARAGAGTAIVPDDFPTIQQAIDSGVFEVLVRPGVYPETLVIARAMNVKGYVPYGSPVDSLPVVAGVVFEDFTAIEFHTLYLKVWSLHILSQVQNRFETSPFWDPLDIELANCALDGGLVDSDAAERGQIEYYLRLCRIGGPVRLTRPQQVHMEDSDVRAAFVLPDWGYDRVTVKRCSFIGPRPFAIDVGNGDCEIYDNRFEGFETPIRYRAGSTVHVDGNTFVGPGIVPVQVAVNGDLSFSQNRVTGFEFGVLVPGEWGDLRATSNVIENCGTGIRAGVRYAYLSLNEIRSCGAGVLLNVLAEVGVSDNQVLSCQGDGMVLQAAMATVEGNVVGQCSGDGIRLTSSAEYRTTVLARNTAYRNGGAGLVFVVPVAGRQGAVDHNIAFENGRHGLEFTGPGSIQLGCNDWYGNAAGAVSGAERGATDLALDPLFCDVALDDVHLSAVSPLLTAAGCGQIGALGLGCEFPVVARLTSFTAAATIEGIEVRWQVADSAPGFVAWLERAGGADGPFAKVECERATDGELTLDIDRSTMPARSYWYRLVAIDRGTTRVLGDAVRVDTDPPTRFALLGTGSNPSPGTLEAAFQLAYAADIALEVFDAQGRRVASMAEGTWPAGIHRATWHEGRTAPAGLYLIRYRHPGGETRRRIALVR